MEILVHIDQSDKDLWNYTEKLASEASSQKEAEATRAKFWGTMTDKYKVIKNRKVAINLRDSVIYEFSSFNDVWRFSRYI